MADELLEAFKRFDHQFPDFRQQVASQLTSTVAEGASVRQEMRAFRNEVLTHFDAIYKRFDQQRILDLERESP